MTERLSQLEYLAQTVELLQKQVETLTLQLETARKIVGATRQFLEAMMMREAHDVYCRHNVGDLCDCHRHLRIAPFKEALDVISKLE